MELKIKDLDHVSIVSQDVERSRRFYCDILGMDDVPRPANFTFQGAWFRKNGVEIHLIHSSEAVQQAGDPPNNPRLNRDVTFARHFAFEVNSMDALVERLKTHDVPIALGPRPRGDGAFQIYFYDPDGHMIEATEIPWNN